MKKILILVGFVGVVFGVGLRVEVVAQGQEAASKASEAESASEADDAKMAAAVGKIRELAKSTPVPFEKIEGLAVGKPRCISGDKEEVYTPELF